MVKLCPSLQVVSVADNGVSLCDMCHSVDEESHALRKRICSKGRIRLWVTHVRRLPFLLLGWLSAP